MKPSSFHIYDASAGSGKTFALVKEYLKILLSSNQKDPFKNVLAITFTNKAVAEMKERIIENLKVFSSKANLNEASDMFISIAEDLSLEYHDLQLRSNEILESIVHNYAAFDISTIDKFTQKLIRTFAYDLHLPMNFEVELETDEVISEAVDNLIAKAGADKQLTKVLVDFAIEKADDDKSFNIEYDFNQIAKLITNERDKKYIDGLQDKSLIDFNALKSQLIDKLHSTEDEIVNDSRDVLNLISECGLEFSDFSNSYLPRHFQKLSEKIFNVSFTNKWQEKIETEPLYPRRINSETAKIIDEIQSQLVTLFYETKGLITQFNFLQALYRNITPLSVLNAINKEVDLIKKDQNIILISEFNSIVSEHIKSQPAPFIYERIGEKFRHYFIDEFQDTSVMQWENLIPLIDNALSGENSSLMLVGDAKQAIYRWRGGRAEQFIDLSNGKIPFNIEPHHFNLQENYRSFKEIVSFNNGFFNHLSSFAFNNENYMTLYQKCQQNITIKNEGFVNITFLEIEEEKDIENVYPKEVLSTILNCIEQGFIPKEICVLVRKNKEGVEIANFIIENSDIDIVSSESLLLANSSEVTFINNLLELVLDKNNKQAKIEVLSFLAENKFKIEDKHLFFASAIHLEINEFFKFIEQYGIFFNPNEILRLPIYEAVEVIIHDFNLVSKSNAYVQFFLDFVFDYSSKKNNGLSDFLDHFEGKKDKLSIIASSENNAVQIMTIHKAKGLEFPVVIFPYANINIYNERDYKVWFELEPENYNNFKYSLLNYNKELQSFGEQGKDSYDEHQAELELDNLNLLYVALTRPIEQLHIIAEKKLTPKGEENLSTFSGLIINYLKHLNTWSDNECVYHFGNSKKASIERPISKDTVTQMKFISTPLKNLNLNIASTSSYLWDTKQQESIEKGNLIHLVLSLIKTSVDIDFTLNEFLVLGIISATQKDELKPIIYRVVEHPELKPYFSSNDTIYTEKEILTESGASLIPDRLVINSKNEVVIMDYKTGEFSSSHVAQIKRYQQELGKMQFSVKKTLLIYINEAIKIKEV